MGVFSAGRLSWILALRTKCADFRTDSYDKYVQIVINSFKPLHSVYLSTFLIHSCVFVFELCCRSVCAGGFVPEYLCLGSCACVACRGSCCVRVGVHVSERMFQDDPHTGVLSWRWSGIAPS